MSGLFSLPLSAWGVELFLDTPVLVQHSFLHFYSLVCFITLFENDLNTINHDALHPLMEEGGIICFLAAKIEQFVSVLVLGVQKGRNLFYWVPVQ